jgi:hypothetical protein
MANITMHPRNAVSAKLAQCYITIDGNRYNFMSALNLKVSFEKTKTEVPILGRPNKGNKSTGSKITGEAEFHLNSSIWGKLAQRFQDTGEDIYFDIQITNEDKTASDVGRQTIMLYDCNFDNIDLAAFDADGEYLTQSMSFTVESFDIPEEFTTMNGML